VNRIVERHGGGILFRSKKYKNIELQVADPVLLEQDGDKELTSRHLYINVDKVVNEQHFKAARCVKDGRVYDVRSLLNMLPIEERALNIPKSRVKRRVSVVDRLKYMTRDEYGNMIPQGPGEFIYLNEIKDPEHPAIEYVTKRGFSAEQLTEQFGAAFCYAENPNLPYKKLPGGFRATPQGRIVFFIKQLGVNRGWQARRLERETGKDVQFLHPYRNEWVTIGEKRNGEMHLLPEFLGSTIGKSPGALMKNKYVIGMGVEKSQTLMGFDAALSWSKETGDKTIGIVEGVLDAARLGPPFCSIMGLRLSTNQASLIANHFERVVYTPDNDRTKKNAEIFCESVESLLAEKDIELVKAPPPVEAEDAGDMGNSQVEIFRHNYKL
jgi:hypothetical protein